MVPLTDAEKSDVRRHCGYPIQAVTVTTPSTSIVPGASALIFRTVFTAGLVTSTSSLTTITGRTGGFVVITDSTGRYRISNVPPDNYYIVAGFNSAPTYYPGTADRTVATTITTTPATTLNTLNFNIPAPPAGTTIRGRVSASTGAPATEATLELQTAKHPLAGFLPASPSKQVPAGVDGVFRFTDVPPGSYDLIARVPDIPTITRSIVVADRPVDDADFTFQAVPVSGRITMVDGSPFPDIESLGSIRVGQIGRAHV